jgi:adenosine kinase
LNLSAPYIPQSFGAQLQQVLPYCNIIIGNESEAEAWASANGLTDQKDLHAVAKAMIALPKSNPSRPRVVIFTQGPDSTVLVSSDDPDRLELFPVEALKDEEIVDTNGAGDAFAGGFLAALVSGKELGECVEAGHKLSKICVGQVCWFSKLNLLENSVFATRQVGPQYKWPRVPIL